MAREVYPPGSWQLNVIRAQGLSTLRREKSWRPVLTLTPRDRADHELVLGVNGENPNQKVPVILDDVHEFMQLQFKVWIQGQSKKKGRRRSLVCATNITLAELAKRQGTESRCEVKLGPCDTVTKVKRQNQSNARNAAYVILKITPPSYSTVPVASTSSSRSHSSERDLASGGEPMSPISSVHPEEVLWKPTEGSRLSDRMSPASSARSPRGRVRRRKGFKLWSDMEDHSSDFSSFSEPEAERPLLEPERLCDNSESCPPVPIRDPWSVPNVIVSGVVCGDGVQKTYTSGLPRYSLDTDTDSIRSQDSVFEVVIEKVSPYRHLKDAKEDSAVEDILSKIQSEWWNVGVSLVSLSALFAAVFGFSSGTLFTINELATRMVAVGSIASGLGILVDSWLIFSYSGANAYKFRCKALDVFGTYFFFCVTARLPALMLLITALTLMLFLLIVAWSTWPTAVVAMCAFVGIMLGLQYVVFTVHRCGVMVTRGIRRIRSLFVRPQTSGSTVAAIEKVEPPARPPRALSRPPARSLTRNPSVPSVAN